MLSLCIILAAVAAATSQQIPGNSFRRVCYYTNWSQYRPGAGRFVPENVDPNLCTHFVYAFATLQGNAIRPFEWNDESQPWSKGMYERFMELKQRNPALKTLLAVGGWNMASGPFSQMVASQQSRAQFIQSAVTFLRKHAFDGLDVDWEYPANRGSPPSDRLRFTSLIRELRAQFELEAVTTGQPRLLLTAAVAAGKSNIDTAYDIPQLSQNLDFISLMTYDLHGSWETNTGHQAPLYPRAAETGAERFLNVDFAAKYWVQKGAAKSKINIGVATYGRSFTLENPSQNGLGASTRQAGNAGQFTRENGFLSYYEICQMEQSGGQVHDDPEQFVRYVSSGDQWVGGEDEASLTQKVCYTKQEGYGGVMVWALDLDDFSGSLCGRGPYPLLHAINREASNPGFNNCPNPAAPPQYPTPARVAGSGQPPYGTPQLLTQAPQLATTYRTPPPHGAQTYLPYQTPQPVVPTQTPAPYVPVQTQRPYLPVQTQAPHIPVQTQAPHLPVQTQAPYIPVQTQAPYLPVQTQAPYLPVQTQAPYVPVQTQRPYIPVQTQAPYIPVQTQRPYIPVQTQAPYIPVQTQAPYIPVQTQAPYIPVQTQRPYIPGQTQAPYIPTQSPYNPTFAVFWNTHQPGRTQAPYVPQTHQPTYGPAVTQAPYNPTFSVFGNTPRPGQTASPSVQPNSQQGFNCMNLANNFYPSPYACDEYYICANQVSYRIQCATGLRYNQVTKHCDWAQNVRCASSITQQPPVYSTQQPSVYYTQPPRQTQNPVQFTLVPGFQTQAPAVPVGGGNSRNNFCLSRTDGFYPDVGDCTHYYQCSNQVTNYMTCPQGLLFDSSRGLCDFPHLVHGCSFSVIG